MRQPPGAALVSGALDSGAVSPSILEGVAEVRYCNLRFGQSWLIESYWRPVRVRSMLREARYRRLPTRSTMSLIG